MPMHCSVLSGAKSTYKDESWSKIAKKLPFPLERL